MVNTEEYYTHPAISQSKLKLLLGPDPSIFNTVREPERYFEEKKHFVIGDAVDCQLTRPPEEFSRRFHTSRIANKPSDTIKSIVNQVYDETKRLGILTEDIGEMRNYFPYILQACNDHEYQMRWNEGTRINKVCEAFEYWEDLKQAEGKQILSEEEDSLISQIVMSIRTNPITSKYFVESKDIEVLYQLGIYFNCNAISCKALLDMVVIDHKNKTIQPIDIKTMGDQSMYFPKSLRQRRYDIQAAFYTQAIFQWCIMQDKYLDYKMLNFKFIVESTTKPGNPLVFTCSDELLYIGMNGKRGYCNRIYEIRSYVSTLESDLYEQQRIPEIKGYLQLLEDYKYYMEHSFEMERRVVESQGEFEIDWNGIK